MTQIDLGANMTHEWIYNSTNVWLKPLKLNSMELVKSVVVYLLLWFIIFASYLTIQRKTASDHSIIHLNFLRYLFENWVLQSDRHCGYHNKPICRLSVFNVDMESRLRLIAFKSILDIQIVTIDKIFCIKSIHTYND